MSMNFYLQAPDGVLAEKYPDAEMAMFEEYPNIIDSLCIDGDDYYQYGWYWTHDRGYCQMMSTVPTVNMSNNNMRFVLNDILGLDTTEYCGDLEDLVTIRASLMLHNVPNCYSGIPRTLDLVNLAIANNWSIYYA